MTSGWTSLDSEVRTAKGAIRTRRSGGQAVRSATNKAAAIS
jgi:hypothetical protein